MQERADTTQSRQLGKKDVPWLGQTAKETVFEVSDDEGKGQLVFRQVVVGTKGYIGLVGAKGGRPKPEIENGFFDNFEITK